MIIITLLNINKLLTKIFVYGLSIVSKFVIIFYFFKPNIHLALAKSNENDKFCLRKKQNRKITRLNILKHVNSLTRTIMLVILFDTNGITSILDLFIFCNKELHFSWTRS